MNLSIRRGIFFVIVGPGGAGKDTMMNEVYAHITEEYAVRVQRLVTATTRLPREGEQEGVDYYYHSHASFRHMIEQDALIEYQQVTAENLYGIPRSSVDPIITRGEHVLGDVDVLGAYRVQKDYPDDAIMIFVTVGSEHATEQERLDILRARMIGRKDKPEAIAERLERARTLEFPFQKLCHYVIYNDDLKIASRTMRQIVARCIRERAQQVTENV